MVKQGEKPHSKNGISIQNTRTLTQGQMKIRIFTGLASSLQSVQRKKVRIARFAFKFRFYRRRMLLCVFELKILIVILNPSLFCAEFLCVFFGIWCKD